MSGNDVSEGKAAGPVPSFRLQTLKKRREFKEASAGPRYSTKAFTMLRRPIIAGAGGAPDPSCHGSPIRFGFTVTKKVGNSVVRNRIRRRLREAVREASREFPEIPMDLVILARHEAIGIEFAVLVADIARSVAALALRGADRRAPIAGKNLADIGKTVPS